MNRLIKSLSPNSRAFIYVALPCIVVAYFAWLNRFYQMDDALIYLRYVRNFHDGLGLVYNAGDRFNGLSSPLYTLLLLVVSLLVSNVQTASILLSGISLAGAAVAGGKLLSRSQYEALFTALVLSSFSYFYWNFGMETALFMLLIGSTLYLYRIGSDLFLITLALAVTTRIEGIILGGLLALSYLYRYKRLPDLGLIVTALVIFLLPFVFNYFYYGAWMAATGSAKIGQGDSGLWGEGPLFLDMLHLIYLGFAANFVATLLFAGFVVFGVYCQRRDHVSMIALAFVVILFLVYTGFNVPNYTWYYAPIMFVAAIFACRGFWQVLTVLHRWKEKRALKRVLSSVAVMAMAFTVFHMVSFERRGPLQHYKEIGNWLALNTPDNSSIAMVEIGTIGWYSGRHVVDILGLVTPHNAMHIANREFHDWIARSQPDYILRHEPIWGHEQSITVLEESGAYLPASGFDYPGYVLLEKSAEVTDQDIAKIGAAEAMNARIFQQMVDSSDAPDNILKLEPDRLFAHAPLRLEFTLDYQASELQVVYGLNSESAELHSGVCFDLYLVGNALEENLIGSDCINPGTPAAELTRDKSINFLGEAGDRLVFETRCLQKCDYAWSFWKKVQVN